MIIKLYWQHSVEWNCLLINSGVLPLSWLPESNLEVVSVVLSFVSETIQITAVEATFGQPKLICLKGRFPRCNNLTRFAFETKLTNIRTKLSNEKICCHFSFVQSESDILGQLYVPTISHNIPFVWCLQSVRRIRINSPKKRRIIVRQCQYYCYKCLEVSFEGPCNCYETLVLALADKLWFNNGYRPGVAIASMSSSTWTGKQSIFFRIQVRANTKPVLRKKPTVLKTSLPP